MAERDDSHRLVPEQPAAVRKPEITPEMRANARANPNSWLYVIDEAFDPHGNVPSWAVIGAYPVNAGGEIIDDFHFNDRYLPSPQALGFPAPSTDLEYLLQLVHARHRPEEDLARAVLDAELFVFAYTPSQRTLVGTFDLDGDVVVPAYTARSLAPRDWPCARAVRGRDVVDLLGGSSLALNAQEVISAVVTAEELERALRTSR
ncbi:type VII secretion system-associated protein [Saccharomonospora piscinae]|uniref:type VII secretion system-associated protein n=1 Tax=Saccharomonospora piscinae TaxID=687388 RepID=UPI0011068C38|nr:type VII secretion system-associated protein [Saccharomonospora piscinae]TLW93203.1 type VII secretion system-associated protein [Saccharomonospora piscinae]